MGGSGVEVTVSIATARVAIADADIKVLEANSVFVSTDGVVVEVAIVAA